MDTGIFDIDLRDFDQLDDMELDFGFETKQKRYINPGRKEIVSKPVKYKNAESLAMQIGDISKDDRFFVFLDGNFIFGDFIEAWIIKNNWNVTEMTISTLSMSYNNIDSLKNLFVADYLQKLNLIVSDYFFSHERHELIPYLYQELDIDNRFQLSVARTHTKICLIETSCGKNIIIHGSANLRTSKNVEQIVIEMDPDLFEFNKSWHMEIIEKYKTINKTIGATELWHQEARNGKATTHQKEETGNRRGGKKTMNSTSEKQQPQRLQKQDGGLFQEEPSSKTPHFRSDAW